MNASSQERWRDGCVLFGLGVAALGIQTLVVQDFVGEIMPVPAWLPARAAGANLTGFALAAAGLGIAAKRRARSAALVLAGVLLAFATLVTLPTLTTRLGDPGAWASTAEILALCGAACVLTGRLYAAEPRTAARPSAGTARRAGTIGRIVFASALCIFGGLHYVYAGFVAGLIPAWMPARCALPYLTGSAFLAAAAGLLLDVQARTAASWLGIMFASWAVLVHVPRVAAGLRSAHEWTGLIFALAMWGAAWLLAGAAPAPVEP